MKDFGDIYIGPLEPEYVKPDNDKLFIQLNDGYFSASVKENGQMVIQTHNCIFYTKDSGYIGNVGWDKEFYVEGTGKYELVMENGMVKALKQITK